MCESSINVCNLRSIKAGLSPAWIERMPSIMSSFEMKTLLYFVLSFVEKGIKINKLIAIKKL